MVSSAYETLITSPGESLTGVLGPGGFGKGGSGLWHPPHMSAAAKSKKVKRQEDALNSGLREDAPPNCRSSSVCLLFCVMQRCLIYKIIDTQDKSDMIDGRCQVRASDRRLTGPFWGQKFQVSSESCS